MIAHNSITDDSIAGIDTQRQNAVIYAYQLDNHGRKAFLLLTAPDGSGMPALNGTDRR